MSTPTGRDNGLPPAARYVALVDVDPPVADHVLALLRDAGVTAVAEPLVGDRGPARDVPPPKRPTDRVHVDVGGLTVARSVVGAALPALTADFHADAAHRVDVEEAERLRRRQDLPADEVDALFAGIVADFRTGSTDPVPRWSAMEDLPEGDPGVDLDVPEPARPPLSSRLLRSAAPEPSPAPVEDADEHYVPPPPPPLPETDRVTRLAWAAMVGGPALLVIAALLGMALEGWVVIFAIVAFLGGFATLIARMRDRHHDGWDDGAVL